MAQIKYLINGLVYTQFNIDNSIELQNELLKIKKVELKRLRAIESSKIYRQTHKDEIRVYNRELQRKKYNTDEAYRTKKQEVNRLYKYNVVDITLNNLLGRPHKFKLDMELHLMATC